jgi:hypothetical protein
MSGKSTLLRTVGVNAVLALAGAPVRARKLTISPLAVGATIRVQDSLQAGMSRFYAEISRIKQLMEAASGPRPLLFLLEEVLAGTTCRDRKAGAEILPASSSKNAIVGDDPRPRARGGGRRPGRRRRERPLEDQLVDGKLAFDSHPAARGRDQEQRAGPDEVGSTDGNPGPPVQ